MKEVEVKLAKVDQEKEDLNEKNNCDEIGCWGEEKEMRGVRGFE